MGELVLYPFFFSVVAGAPDGPSGSPWAFRATIMLPFSFYFLFPSHNTRREQGPIYIGGLASVPPNRANPNHNDIGAGRTGLPPSSSLNRVFIESELYV